MTLPHELQHNTWDLKVHGTLGILLRALRKNQKSAEEMAQIPKSLHSNSSLHISSDLIQYALEELSKFK